MSVPLGPYSPSRLSCGWVVTSGQLGTVPGADGTPRLVEGGVLAELRQALSNLSAVLGTHGAGLDDVVKATVFLVDLTAYSEVNGVWMDTFGVPRPARSVVGVAALPLGALVEVEAWALAGTGDDTAPLGSPGGATPT